MMSLSLWCLAAMLNAAMDKFENENFYTSVFRNLNVRFWYKRESWKYGKMVFGWRFDSWHVAKSAMVVLLALAIVLYKPLVNWWTDILIYGAAWNLVFNLFLNKLFKK